MYPFVLLAPVLALVAGQVEPSGAAAPEEAPSAQELPPPAPKADRVEKAPRRAERALAPVPKPTGTSELERAQVARAALAFLDALLAGDASGLAAASTERFSFDGDVRTGKDEVRRAWRTILTGRDAGQHGVLLDLEVLPATDAVARLGPPPPRLAPLASARGTWVGIANVSSRPVVVFVTREGNRWSVAGME